MQEELLELGRILTGLPHSILGDCCIRLSDVEEAAVEMKFDHLVTVTELGVLGRGDVEGELVSQER